MRFIHTSDWHLGRSLSNQSMHEDQVRFVDWFVDTVRQHQAELVVVAGDIFDRAVPPNESVALWRSALIRIREAGAKVVAIAGNHDGADRIAVHDGLTDFAGIYIRGGYDRAAAPIVIHASDGPLHIAAIPYLDPALRPATPDESQGEDPAPPTHESVLTEQLNAARASATSARLIAVAHAFVTGGAESTSERHLSVGGTGQVPAAVFHGFCYVALGHLHRPQSFNNAPHIRYSGTPLAYSFSEDHKKQVVLVDLAQDGSVTQTPIPVPDAVCRPVTTITGTLAQLLADASLCQFVNHFVRAIVTDRVYVTDARTTLASRFPYIREITMQPEGIADHAASEKPLDRSHFSAIENCRAFWQEVTQTPLTEAEESIIRGALQTSVTPEAF